MIREDKYLKEVLLSHEEIQKICHEMGTQITNDYQNNNDLLLIGLLKGCHPFMSDLVKHIDLLFEIDYMDVSSFFGGIKAKDEVSIIKDLSTSVKDRDILIIEDIVDSGNTIKKVIDLLYFRGANSVEVATLINKESGRKVDLSAKYIGYEVKDAFIIGYGLDYDEKYRNLCCVGIPKDELIKEFEE